MSFATVIDDFNLVIIPIQCEYLALEGLGKLLNTIKSIQKLHNEYLQIEGILLTMYDIRLNLSNQVKKEVKIHFNQMVFKTIVHRNVKLGEATSFGKSIIDYDVSIPLLEKCLFNWITKKHLGKTLSYISS